MTKLVQIASVLALVVVLAGCTTGQANDETGMNSGDRTFERAQMK